LISYLNVQRQGPAILGENVQEFLRPLGVDIIFKAANQPLVPGNGITHYVFIDIAPVK
jgi:hypothetical protein